VCCNLKLLQAGGTIAADDLHDMYIVWNWLLVVEPARGEAGAKYPFRVEAHARGYENHDVTPRYKQMAREACQCLIVAAMLNATRDI